MRIRGQGAERTGRKRHRRRKRGWRLLISYALRGGVAAAVLLCAMLTFRGALFLFSLASGPAENDALVDEADDGGTDMEELTAPGVDTEPLAVVVLDPGHGGVQPGCVVGEIEEKDLTLSITELLKAQLEADGVSVVMTRTTDEDVDLSDRAAIANAAGGACFVSIHCNSYEDSSIAGLECFYYNSDESEGLAELISAATARYGITTRQVKEENYQVLRESEIPAVLIEVGYMTNPDELTELISPDYQQTLASAIAEGIMELVNS